MLDAVLASLFGGKFVGLATYKLGPPLITIGKYAAAGYGFWACMQAPRMISSRYDMRYRMIQAFKAGGIYNVHKRRDYGDGQIKEVREYPWIERISRTTSALTISFRLPPGYSPESLKQREYVFRQEFGQYAKLVIGDVVHQVVVATPLPSMVPYSYPLVQRVFDKVGGLPVFAGITESGQPITYDMRRNPHLGIVGVTGYGKSSALRVLLCSWLQYFSPEQLRLYLGDLKKTEFQQYSGIPHVEHVAINRLEVITMLQDVCRLMDNRSTLLGRAGATNIDQYQKRTGKTLPYVVVCIDEVALLSKEKAAHEYLEEIGAIGRALGVFLILSQQRVDSEIIGGRLKNNLTVRVAYRMSDALNSRMFLDNDAAAQLSVPGRAIVKEPDRISEVQIPWLSEEEAEKIIDQYRIAENDVVTTDTHVQEEEIIFGELIS
ncbi:FtsK/SpoIIIE domain-containing protein [Brevibacillus massiliensis]|uniref:FtsK/SpoIIIE domain-containing protein n=1 Tax=Brevibacillus massiliensis TaxID=1118054 RepID=UPI00030C4E6F|nr:FtsK/SpoIIIE domain-containing protein [Brevibacillus massiliensis]